MPTAVVAGARAAKARLRACPPCCADKVLDRLGQAGWPDHEERAAQCQW